MLGPGETIVAVNGERLEKTEFYKLDRALQKSDGKPVELMVRSARARSRTVQVQPKLMDPFSEQGLQFAGMVPRAMVIGLTKPSSVEGKLSPVMSSRPLPWQVV